MKTGFWSLAKLGEHHLTGTINGATAATFPQLPNSMQQASYHNIVANQNGYKPGDR